MLVRRALFGAEGADEDEHLLNSAMRYFLDYYRAHKLDYTVVYPGVLESLAKIQPYPGGGKRQMAVLTNKPVGPARAICEALGLSQYLFEVYGGDSFPVKKPDPLGLNTLMDEAGVRPGETLMVGDSGVDMRTARNAGAWTLGCSYGSAPQTLDEVHPDVMVDHAARVGRGIQMSERSLRIVIPGGSGQMGQMLARNFVAQGHHVSVFSRAELGAVGVSVLGRRNNWAMDRGTGGRRCLHQSCGAVGELQIDEEESRGDVQLANTLDGDFGRGNCAACTTAEGVAECVDGDDLPALAGPGYGRSQRDCGERD